MKYARVLNDDEILNDVVGLGSKVKLWDTEFEEEVEYSIVSSTEADLANNKISQESPVGKALLGKKKDDVITVATPGGEVVFKILEITR